MLKAIVGVASNVAKTKLGKLDPVTSIVFKGKEVPSQLSNRDARCAPVQQPCCYLLDTLYALLSTSATANFTNEVEAMKQGLSEVIWEEPGKLYTSQANMLAESIKNMLKSIAHASEQALRKTWDGEVHQTP
ncbi:hypothetical protein NDU88_011319 [Pleurodeles waltl]|uniref:Uncharacterized protein n=1 Tax=Pleurodeles waltl TaxID=8319 RepID=A0AAV7QZP2_PLEWA|nr:hypothetical protein NDU88_011319 [Pleurodeles waltl]